MRNEGAGKPYGSEYMVSGDGPRNADSRCLMAPALYGTGWESEVKRFYEHITMKLLHRSAYTIAGHNQVDIVRDVLNLAQVHFASTVFSLPLKTEDSPRGLFSETELYLLMAVVFASIFYDADPARSFPLRHAARNIAQKLGKLMELKVNLVEKTGLLQGLLNVFYRHDTTSPFGGQLIRRLLSSQTPPKDLVWTHILPTAGAMVANQSQLFSQCLDYYLSEEGRVHLPEINRLSKENNAAADDVLLH